MDKFQVALMNLYSGNFFQFRREFIDILPLEEAVFIQDLLNYCTMRMNAEGKHRKEEKNGWFLCSRSYLSGPKSLRWDRHKQTRILSRLKSKGYISVKMKGIPPRRYIKIDVVKIHKDIQNTGCWNDYSGRIRGPDQGYTSSSDLGLTSNPDVGQTYMSNTQEEENVSNVATPVATGHTSNGQLFSNQTKTTSTDPHHHFDQRMAYKLWRFVNPNSRKKKHPSSLLEWAKHFKLLRTEDGKKRREIREVLQWYIEHAPINNNPTGDHYCPIAESGKAFREKFTRISSQMWKQKHSTGEVEDNQHEERMKKARKHLIIINKKK